MGRVFLKSAFVLAFGILAVNSFATSRLAEPSALLEQVGADGVKQTLELRCVKGLTESEPYYCEIARSLNGVEISAHAIYPKQLQSLWARYWMEQSMASGSYPSTAQRPLTWKWKIFAQHSEASEVLAPAAGVTGSDLRTAQWLFDALRSWSNFGG